MERIPEYKRIYDKLKAQIQDGFYNAGDFIPSEPELEAKFKVSRITVRKAIELLSREGLVEVKQGKGTSVSDYKTRQNMNAITSITETLRKRGYVVTSSDVKVEFIRATPHIAEDFEIPYNSLIVRVQRVQVCDGVPIVIMRNHFLPQDVPNIEKHIDEITSLYSFLRKQYNIRVETAYDRISARAATGEDAALLNVSEGTALCYLKRVCRQNNRVVEVTRLKVIGDKYEFALNLKGESQV